MVSRLDKIGKSKVWVKHIQIKTKYTKTNESLFLENKIPLHFNKLTKVLILNTSFIISPDKPHNITNIIDNIKIEEY